MFKNIFSGLTILILIALMAMSVNACKSGGSGDGEVDSDMVTNPASASGQNGKGEALPELSFETNEHDFGQVIQGEVISYSFPLSNTGEAPLVIADVTSSCGCTVADYPKQALAPGDEGYITVTFDSKGRRGYQSKLVTVVANTVPNAIPLKIMAQVVVPED